VYCFFEDEEDDGYDYEETEEDEESEEDEDEESETDEELVKSFLSCYQYERKHGKSIPPQSRQRGAPKKKQLVKRK
jgi:hypothetical protein